LFATGIRHRSSVESVTADVGETSSEVVYAGAQGDFAGLDQINIQLPRSLAGRGIVDVVIRVDDYWASNRVQVSIK
jgi:uncharacterized protein (TIGR03437 family)